MPLNVNIKLDKKTLEKLKKNESEFAASIDRLILGWQAETDAEDHLIDVGLMEMTFEHFVKRAWVNGVRRKQARGNSDNPRQPAAAEPDA